MLSIRVSYAKRDQQFHHVTGPLEFGRGPRRVVERVLINDVYVSRDQLRLEELPDGRIRLDNLSLGKPLMLSDGTSLPAGVCREVALPVSLAVGQTRLEIQQEQATNGQKTVLQTIAQPIRPPAPGQVGRPLTQLGDAPAPEILAHWLETVIALQRSAADLPELYDHAAGALVELIGLDEGLVLLRRNGNWETVAAHTSGTRGGSGFSRTLLDRVVAQRRTFYQDLKLFAQPTSLAGVEAAVVSPIFGLHDEVIGALYGVRQMESLVDRGAIRPLEAEVVQLLAAAIGANLARASANRTRVQFEQFFSPELARELERDPALLEGRKQEVTVLFSDLRGFSTLAERLGPQHTCRLLRDLMERFSERIAEQGGVIVDYIGDGILAMWNAPAPQQDHAARACRAALAMLAELPALSDRWRDQVGGPLHIGIGLNTGEAQVGNTGSSRKFKYGPLGHTVNVASRVQNATKDLRLPLLITASTHDQLQGAFATRRLGRVRVVGLTGPVMLYELHGGESSEWPARRQAYEAALALYEARQWSSACQTLLPLLDLPDPKDTYDVATVKLMRQAWECLESPPKQFDPVLELERQGGSPSGEVSLS